MASGMFGSVNRIVINSLNSVMSRGIGIRCYNNLYDITDYCCGGTGQFVVQKYI